MRFFAGTSGAAAAELFTFFGFSISASGAEAGFQLADEIGRLTLGELTFALLDCDILCHREVLGLNVELSEFARCWLCKQAQL